MGYGIAVRRGGAHNRLAEPSWRDPLDTSHSKASGGRWNPPGEFGMLYLNATERMARLQVRHKLAGQPFDVEDLDPAEQHDLIELQVADCQVLDCVSSEGLKAARLPNSYPVDGSGAVLSHERCQQVGAQAYGSNELTGIACRSAATGANHDDEELALFDREARRLVKVTTRWPFADWYLSRA